MRRLRRVLAWTAGVLALATVLITAWHLPPVRRALGLGPLGHPTSGVCPFGYGGAGSATASASASASVRQGAAAAQARVAHADEPRAHARPALGFTLGATTTAELDAWASAHGVACTRKHAGASIECTNVPAELLASSPGMLGATAVWFELNARGTLRAVKAVRDATDVTRVASAFTTTEDALTAAAGAPTTIDGSAAPAILAHGMLRQAAVEYRFQDYRAVLRATHMGATGYTLTESYATLD